VNGYDRQAWAEVQDWRNRQPRVRLGQFMPDAVRDGAQRVVRKSVDTLRQIPGAEQFQQALSAALQGLLRTLMDVGAASVPRSTAVRRLKKKDYEVERFENIRALALQPCDTAFPRGKRFGRVGPAPCDAGPPSEPDLHLSMHPAQANLSWSDDVTPYDPLGKARVVLWSTHHRQGGGV
jgi:hypothetical protein